MAMKKGNGGTPKCTFPKVPDESKYNPEERLAAATAQGQRGIQYVQNGTDLQEACALLMESCQQLEQIRRDCAHPGLFDDSRTESGYRGKRYREWISGQCSEKLAVLYKGMADCACVLHQPDAFAQAITHMVTYAELADRAIGTKESREVLLSNLFAAGDLCLHQMDLADPKRAFRAAFRILKLSEQSDAVKFQPEEAVLGQMKDAAKMICESVFMAPALGGNLNESFRDIFPLRKTDNTVQHLAIYADLEADLLEWMQDHGEHWHGMWDGTDCPLDSVYSATVRELLNAGVMETDKPFRQRVLHILGKMQDPVGQLRLAQEVLGYCASHQSGENIKASTRLVEDVKDAVSRDGKYNCQPMVWLYVQKSLTDAYYARDKYRKADAAAVEALQDVAELRQGCAKGKWTHEANKAMEPSLAHMLDMVETEAYMMRAAVSNHYFAGKQVMVFLNQAEAVLDRGEGTDRLFPQYRRNIQFLKRVGLSRHPEYLDLA